ncbi:MAG: DUF72 domain-containing protein [Candidatus Lokiarchaeota archaeon]|nr:DUF72 domain-containing protein [Candidatus Lokiarchaeota archaeon]
MVIKKSTTEINYIIEFSLFFSDSVSKDFRFSIKFWNQITHIKDYRIGIQNTRIFLNAFKPLIDKIAFYLLQFPPSFRYNNKNFSYIQEILQYITSNIKVAVELRHNSWFNASDLKMLLNGQNHVLGTVYLINIYSTQ